MAGAATYQCPNCSGVLSYDVETGLLTCGFCGSTFAEGELEKAIPIGSVAAIARPTEHVKTVDEFLKHAPWTEASAHSIGYSCPACGANVVADQSAVTASCPFCGNNMVVSGIATQSNIPHWVLPFSVTREDAEVAMRRHFEHKWYLSRSFNASLEHMQGVYVPYHLYDIRVSGHADYIASYVKSRGDAGTEVKYLALSRAGTALFERIPVDGSSKMPDAHMDAIAPFSLHEMRDFSTSYIAGYLTEVPDESAEACFARAESRAKQSFEDDLRKDVFMTQRVNTMNEIVERETNAHLEGVSSCVLPVWLAHCTWNGENMLFAVNGETGKCVGDLPVDSMRRMVTIAVTMLMAFIIGFGASYLSALGKHNDAIGGNVIFGIITCAIVTFIVDAYLRSQMRTAEEATTASMSYSGEGLVVTERWDNGEYLRKKSQAREKLDQHKAGLL
ncbi:MAG: hypothetical protein J6S36_02435 [Eggerthellaceae bacterium]|nr:hypothetical protein [Eggerthellaceae bacterium]